MKGGNPRIEQKRLMGSCQKSAIRREILAECLLIVDLIRVLTSV